MNRLSDPSFFLQLSESFIKTARLETSGERPRLTEIKEISSAELMSQPNPIIQIADEGHELPIPVASTLSLGETIYQSHAFDQIGFSTLTEFIGVESAHALYQYELGVFQRADGMPAPTASPAPLELVFCGFNSNAIPELSDAFPNLDAKPTSITLSALDLFRFLKSQIKGEEKILLIEIGSERTHLFLIDGKGLSDIKSIELGHQALFEVIAEVLHLHYLGSAIKLFTRSGFDSSELAPKLGALFGNAILSVIEAEGWEPSSVHMAGLLRAQSWFQDAVFSVLNIDAFQVDASRLPFDIDNARNLSSADSEILAKVYASLTSDEDFSWHNEYLSCLGKSSTIARRESSGSNSPFPTAHPDRLPPAPQVNIPHDEPVSAYAPPLDPHPPPTQIFSPPIEEPPPVAPTASVPARNKEVKAIPDHLLNDIEDYEGEFEDLDDYGGGRIRSLVKLGLLALSFVIIGVMVTIVFFPKAAEKYLKIRPPHIDFDESDPQPGFDALALDTNSDYAATVEMTESALVSGIQDLQEERESTSFGGLYLPTNPYGATVIVGDMEPGLSPIKLPNVEPGTYDVVISKEGYETQTLTVTINSKEVKKIETIVLRPLK